METARAENLEKKRIGLQLAYEAVMTDDAAKVLAYGRNKNRRHEAGIALMQGYQIKDQQIEDEDEMIHVGDIITNQIMPGSSEATATAEAKASPATPSIDPATATPAVAPVATAARVATASSKFSKIASAAAMAAGLLGLGATGPAAWNSISSFLSSAAEVKVLWDGQEIKPGESATATSEGAP